MGKKINKKSILDEIKNKIEICKEYQKKDPDFTAMSRVDEMELDLCADQTYYVNLTLNNDLIKKSLNLSDRLKYLENKIYLPSVKEMDKCFEETCLIRININSDGTTKKTVTPYSCFSDLVKQLTNLYFNNDSILLFFNPRSSLFNADYFADDIASAFSNNKKSIIYSIRTF